MATGPHISLAAEQVASIGGFSLSNSAFTSLIVSALIIGIAAMVSASFKQTNRPTGAQNVAEWIVEALYNLVYSVTNDHRKSRLFFPFIASFFLFILFNNWVSVLPGVGTIGIVEEPKKISTIQLPQLSELTLQVKASEPTKAADEAAFLTADEDTHDENSEVAASEDHGSAEASHAKFVPIIRPATADLNTTIALAIISMALVQFWGIRFLHLGYFKKFLNFSSPIMFFVGILETVSEFSKIISFAFRLFGNVFAGEVLLSVISFIGGTYLFFVPIPFYGLEIFVGFIQALVFSMLSLVFFNMATLSHDSH